MDEPLPSSSNANNNNNNNSNSAGPSQLPPPPAVDQQHEFERRRKECLMKVLQSEHRMDKLRSKWHKSKLVHDTFPLEKLQEAILRSDVFQRRKQQLDADFDRRCKVLLMTRQLRLDTLARKLRAERQFAEDNFDWAKANARQRIGDGIETKMEALAQEEQWIQAKLTEHADAIASKRASKIARYLEEEEEEEAPRPRVKENGKSTKAAAKVVMATAKGESSHQLEQRQRPKIPRWKDIPVAIAQLPNACIQEDLAIIL